MDWFLGEDSNVGADVRRAHADAFDLARKINCRCHSLIDSEVKIKNRDGQGLLIAGCFLRALQHYQSAILLLGRGMVAAAKVAIRAELETVFVIGSAAADYANFRAIVNDNIRERFELLKTARKYDYPILHPAREAADRLHDELEQKAKEVGATAKLTVSQLSKQAGLHQLYVSVYPLLSRAAHTLVGDIDSYLVVDAEGDVREMRYAPQLDEINGLLVTAVDFILLASDGVCRHFEVPRLDDMRSELKDFTEAAAI